MPAMVNRSDLSFEEGVAQELVDGGFITRQQMAQARESACADGAGLLDMLVSEGIFVQEVLIAVLSPQLRIPVVDLRQVEIDPRAASLVPAELARKYGIVPTGFDSDGSLRIAARLPNDLQLSSDLSSMTGRRTKFSLAIGSGLDELIQRVYPGIPEQPPEPPLKAKAEREERTSEVVDSPEGGGPVGTDEAPAAEAVDAFVLQAAGSHASHIHLVPGSDSSRVLFRLNGVLTGVAVIPRSLQESMNSRIKTLASMDVSETIMPQNGFFNTNVGGKKTEFRVPTIAASWGEMMVLQVVGAGQGLLDLEALGLESQALQVWRQLLALPRGLLLVSGTADSGKTTTLYASVASLLSRRGNIKTIEDPVDHRLDGVNQVQVNPAAGMDYQSGLRSILRLDPDVILVGEIRDEATAKSAVDAALGGCLVLASIQSNGAPLSILRLLDLGVEPSLLAAGVAGALSQRLVRRIHPQCRIQAEPTVAGSVAYEEEMQEPAPPMMAGQGCDSCDNSGFSGRTGVFAVMAVDESIRKLIVSGAGGHAIRRQALTNGMIPLRRAAMIKARERLTTLDEVSRGVVSFEPYAG